jgi:hypothetical protein
VVETDAPLGVGEIERGPVAVRELVPDAVVGVEGDRIVDLEGTRVRVDVPWIGLEAELGVCTPTIVSPAAAYFSCHALRYGSVRSQLTQVYVQKSTSTTRPRRGSDARGSVLSHPVARSNEAKRPSSGSERSSPASR